MVTRVSDHLVPFKMVELNGADLCVMFVNGRCQCDWSSLSCHGLFELIIFIFLIVFFVFTVDTFNVHILLHRSHIVYHLNMNDVAKVL